MMANTTAWNVYECGETTGVRLIGSYPSRRQAAASLPSGYTFRNSRERYYVVHRYAGL